MTAAPSYARVQRRCLWQSRTARIIGAGLHVLTIGTVVFAIAWLATVGLERATYQFANPDLPGLQP